MSTQPRIVNQQGLKGVPRGQKRGFTVEQLQLLRDRLQNDSRGLALLCVGIDTMLRSSDLRALKVSALRSPDGTIREQFTIAMAKGNYTRTATCTLSPKARAAIAGLINHTGKRDDDYLFTMLDDPHASSPLCEQSLQREVKAWALMLGLDATAYSSHSLRRTKAAILYARTKDVAHIQELLAHRWLTSTQAYLGATKAQALDLARQHDV
jgi:integrase